MRETIILSIMVAMIAISIGVAHAETYIINMPSGSSSPQAPFFWQVESTGNTDGILSVAVGDVVRWENADTAAHTVASGNPTEGSSDLFYSGLIGPGKSFSYQFDEAGEFEFYCDIHEWMSVGIVKVQQVDDKILHNIGSGLNDGVGFDVHYVLDRSLEDGVEIDQTQNTLTFTLAGQTENDQLEIRLPEGLIKNPNAVWADDVQITDFTSEVQGETTLLIIPLEHNSEEVKIMGTQVIPEFGQIAGIVLMLSIVAVIIMTAKTQKFGMPKL